MIPLARPDVGPDEAAAVAEVLSSGMIAQGRRVSRLEERWAERIGVRHAVAMSSGTAALMSTLAGLGLGPGDEVVTVAYTVAATANAILSTGATPVFVDIEPDTFLVDAARIEARIGPRTRALVPVHLFGLVADMDMIRAIADRHGLAVVEDACQAHGASFRGRAAGSFGHGAFSLAATTNLTTAEGGLVTTNDDRLADWLRRYRNHGQRSGGESEILGYNFRLTDVAAAIGLVQLDKLDRTTIRRRQIAATYDAALAELPVRTPIAPVGRTHVYHQYVVRVGDARDAILAALREAGVEADVPCRVPVHRQAHIQERGLHADLPETDRASATTIALPMFPGLTGDEQARVIGALEVALRGQREDAAVSGSTSGRQSAGATAR